MPRHRPGVVCSTWVPRVSCRCPGRHFTEEENRALRADGAGRSTAVQPGQAPEGHHVAAPTEEGSAWLQSSAVWAGEGTGAGSRAKTHWTRWRCLGYESARSNATPDGDKPAWESRSGVGESHGPPGQPCDPEGKLWRQPVAWEPRCHPTWTPSSPAATAAEPRHFHPGCRGNRLPVTSGKRTAP